MMTIIQGWIIYAFLHGLYDFFLSLKMERTAYLQIVVMGGISFYLGRVALRASRRKRLGESAVWAVLPVFLAAKFAEKH